MGLDNMQVGLLLGDLRAAGGLGALAAKAEELGFDSLWVGDHVAFPAPILDPLQILACFAAHTVRVRLGTCVYLVPLRPPTLIAKMVSSLDFLTSGRVIFGIGVGGEFPAEFNACAVPVRERGARANEAIEAIRALWQKNGADFHGRFFDIPSVQVAPSPVQIGGPPIWIGGRAEPALRRAARFGDGYVGHFLTPDGFRQRMLRIRALAEAQGRDSSAIRAALLAFAFVAPDRRSALARAGTMLSAMYGQPMEKAAGRYAVLGTAEDCRATVEQYAAAGVEHMILSPLAVGDEVEEQIHALATIRG